MWWKYVPALLAFAINVITCHSAMLKCQYANAVTSGLVAVACLAWAVIVGIEGGD